MKKLRIYAAFLLMLMFLMALPVSASSTQPKLIDNDGLLSSEEFDELNTSLEEKSTETGDDIVVLTVTSLDGKDATAYADDYYDENGYDDNGILLLVSMTEREYAISTKGTCIEVFTLDILDNMEECFVPYLSDGDYYDAFDTFASDADYYITQGVSRSNGTDTEYESDYEDYEYEEPGFIILTPPYIIFAVILGCIFSFIFTGFKKAKLTSVKNQIYASNYVTDRNITKSKDVFLYHTLTVTPKPKEEHHDSGEHMSSSGDMHGGDHGHF